MASMTPDFLSKILFWKRSRSRDLEHENISKELNKWEDCVNKIQKILIWDDPVISSLSLVAVNLLFWLLIHFECKFYGLLFTALLTLTLHQLWFEHIQHDLKISEGPRTMKSDAGYSSNTRLLTMAEISRYASKAQDTAKNACLKLRRLRQDQPGTFCVMTCICFLFLSIIGRSISGIALLYSFIMMLMIVPGACIHFLPPYFVNSFTNIFNSSHRDNDNDNDNEVDEYLPDTSGETLALLKLAGDLQLTAREDDEDSNDILLEQMSARTNDTAESSCSKLSFCPDASMMPSHENSLDFLEFDRVTSESKKSDSNDSEFSDIQFQSKHFNGDSSDEEDEFSKGLEFRHSDKSKRPKEENKSETVSAPSFLSAANVGRNIISMGTNILTHVVKQQTEVKRNDRESSSDTDSFELISEEDM